MNWCLFFQVCSNGRPGSEVAPYKEVQGLNHRNTQKKNLLQNHLAKVLELLYVIYLNVFYNSLPQLSQRTGPGTLLTEQVVPKAILVKSYMQAKTELL